jgi:hypothetical protein
MMNTKDLNNCNQAVKYLQNISNIRLETHIKNRFGENCKQIFLVRKSETEYYGFAAMFDGKLVEIAINVFKEVKKEIQEDF